MAVTAAVIVRERDSRERRNSPAVGQTTGSCTRFLISLLTRDQSVGRDEVAMSLFEVRGMVWKSKSYFEMAKSGPVTRLDERSMMSASSYVMRVRGLLAQSSEALSVREQDEVRHLLDHGEPAEALRTLAWIVVDGEKKVSRSIIAMIRELASGAVSEADMPRNLDACAID